MIVTRPEPEIVTRKGKPSCHARYGTLSKYYFRLVIATTCVAFLSLSIFGQSQPPGATRPQFDRNTYPNRPSAYQDLQVGKPAPDFELPILKEETAANGKKFNRITDEKVRLSAFRDKQVVCLFMSSYT
jgi:hypothetical protein